MFIVGKVSNKHKLNKVKMPHFTTWYVVGLCESFRICV